MFNLTDNPIPKWTSAYIEQTFINPKTPWVEDQHIEYKDSRILKSGNREDRSRKITKAISAFANADGGVVIFGVKQKDNTERKGAVPVGFDEGLTVAEIEDIGRILNSSVGRRIPDLLIHPVKLADSENYIAVVSVPVSIESPHQASDHLFYGRRNFENLPLLEHEIRALYYRQSSPDLELTAQLEKIHSLSQPEEYTLYLHTRNLSVTPCEYAVFNLFVDSRITILGRPQNSRSPLSGHIESFKYGNTVIDAEICSLIFSPHNFIPIFGTELSFTICYGGNGLHVKFPYGVSVDKSQVFVIKYEIHAPKMPVKSGFIEFGYFGQNDVVSIINQGFPSPGALVT